MSIETISSTTWKRARLCRALLPVPINCNVAPRDERARSPPAIQAAAVAMLHAVRRPPRAPLLAARQPGQPGQLEGWHATKECCSTSAAARLRRCLLLQAPQLSRAELQQASQHRDHGGAGGQLACEEGAEVFAGGIKSDRGPLSRQGCTAHGGGTGVLVHCTLCCRMGRARTLGCTHCPDSRSLRHKACWAACLTQMPAAARSSSRSGPHPRASLCACGGGGDRHGLGWAA